MTDRLYQGPIDTRFSLAVIQSNRIAYFCDGCARSIDVPTGTRFCHACLRAQKVAS